MKFFDEFGVKLSAPMKLIRATFPVGEGILCIAVNLECMGLIVL